MATGTSALPDDIEKLKAMLAERDAAIRIQQETIRELSGKLLWAEEKYRAMELKYFGRKSEQYSPEEDKQNRLFDEAELHADENAPSVTEQVAAHERKKRGVNRSQTTFRCARRSTNYLAKIGVAPAAGRIGRSSARTGLPNTTSCRRTSSRSSTCG
jgi:hypothetical protein